MQCTAHLTPPATAASGAGKHNMADASAPPLGGLRRRGAVRDDAEPGDGDGASTAAGTEGAAAAGAVTSDDGAPDTIATDDDDGGVRRSEDAPPETNDGGAPETHDDGADDAASSASASSSSASTSASASATPGAAPPMSTPRSLGPEFPHAPLPEGWDCEWSESHKAWYYFHAAAESVEDAAAQWNPPLLKRLPPDDDDGTSALTVPGPRPRFRDRFAPGLLFGPVRGFVAKLRRRTSSLALSLRGPPPTALVLAPADDNDETTTALAVSVAEGEDDAPTQEGAELVAAADEEPAEVLHSTDTTKDGTKIAELTPDQIMAEFTKAELQKIRSQFNDVDEDRSGYIDENELRTLLTIVNNNVVPTAGEIRKIMKKVDATGDGRLDYEEYLMLIYSMKVGALKRPSAFQLALEARDEIVEEVFKGLGEDLGKFGNLLCVVGRGEDDAGAPAALYTAHSQLSGTGSPTPKPSPRRKRARRPSPSEKRRRRPKRRSGTQTGSGLRYAHAVLRAPTVPRHSRWLQVVLRGRSMPQPPPRRPSPLRPNPPPPPPAQDFERGLRDMRLERLKELREVYNMTIDELVAGDDANYPQAGDSVTLHIKGMLLTGEVFESTRLRRQTFKFKVGSKTVTEGLDMVVTTLCLGSKTRVVMPPAVCYGIAGLPPKVPPNATVVFELELVEIV